MMKKEPVAAVAVVEKKPAYPEFAAPEGFEVPEGTKEGEAFQSVAQVRVKGGKLCLVSLDGAEFPGGDVEEGEPADDEVVEGEAETTAGQGPEDGGYAAFQEEIAQQQNKMKGK